MQYEMFDCSVEVVATSRWHWSTSSGASATLVAKSPRRPRPCGGFCTKWKTHVLHAAEPTVGLMQLHGETSS